MNEKHPIALGWHPGFFMGESQKMKLTLCVVEMKFEKQIQVFNNTVE